MNNLVRLNKHIASKGLCSRREADEYIQLGLVKVNGVIQTQLGLKVDNQRDKVELLPAATKLEAQKATILYHKPLGIVSCQPEERNSGFARHHSERGGRRRDPQKFATKEEQDIAELRRFGIGYVPQPSQEQNNRRSPAGGVGEAAERYLSAIQLCTKDKEYKSAQQRKFLRQLQSQSTKRIPPRPEPRSVTGWATAGRLDVNSTGLLVLTQAGSVASQIIAPDAEVEKEYLVRIDTSLQTWKPKQPINDDPDNIRVFRNRSVPVVAAAAPPPPFVPPRLDGDYPETLEVLEKFRNGVYDRDDDLLRAYEVDIVNEDQLRMILIEGKHHHIRRMCSAVGWRVKALKRVRIGNIVLGDLPLGYWRYLGKNEEF